MARRGEFKHLETAPFRILAVGLFDEASPRRPVRIAEAADLEGAVKALGGSVEFAVENIVQRSDRPIRVALEIGALDDLTPRAIVRRIPELSRAAELTAALKDLAGGRLEPEAFRQSLAKYRDLVGMAGPLKTVAAALDGGTDKPSTGGTPAASAEEGAGDDEIDKLLGMVGGPENDGSGKAEAERQLEKFIAGLGGSARTAKPKGLAGAVSEAEKIVARQWAAVLHHPAFQARERFWRGLRALVERVDFRNGVLVEVAAAPREQLPGALAETILAPELAGQAETPLGAVLVDAEVANEPPDLEWLQAVAQVAQALQVPFALAAAPAFFGLESGRQLSQLPYLGTILDEPAYDLWRSFRKKDEARWVALCVNRFLARAAWNANGRKSNGLVEPIERHDDRLWGLGIWPLGAVMARSFVDRGWPTEITGADDGRIEGFDLHPITLKSAETAQIPLEALLGAEHCRDLADQGFAPLACRQNRDSVFWPYAPSAHLPAHFGDEERKAGAKAMAQLAFQLAVTRVAGLLDLAWGELAGRVEPATAARAVEDLLWRHIANTGPGARVSAEPVPHPADDSRQVLRVQVSFGRAVIHGGSIELALPL